MQLDAVKCTTLLWILLQMVGTATAAALPALGWIHQPFFVEAKDASTDAPFHREFYPVGENSSMWTERVLVNAQEGNSTSTPQLLLDAESKRLSSRCSRYTENRLPLDKEYAVSNAVMMWHCGLDRSTGHGTVGIIRSIVGQDRAYIVAASGNYEPFDSDKTPLLKTQLTRWTDFQRSFAICDELTIPGCAPDPSVLMNAPAAPLTAEESKQVALAEARGKALFQNDQLGWHATDYVMEQKLLNRKKGGKFMAIARADGSGDVYFVQKRSVLHVELDENARPLKYDRQRKPPDFVSTRLVALNTASKQSANVCGETINNVVLPTEDRQGWWVYLLGATTQANVAIIGRHLRIRTDSSGKRIESKEPSTFECMAIRIRPDAPESLPKSTWAAVTVTHLVSEVPWETHVFQSLTWSTPIFVLTHHAAWHVQGGRIVKIDLESKAIGKSKVAQTID